MKGSNSFIEIIKSKSVEKVLYLSIALCLIGASYDIGQKKNHLRNLVNSFEILKKSSNDQNSLSSPAQFNKVQSVHFDHQNSLSSFYCGIDQEQLLIFKFNSFGKVKIWAQHFLNANFTFPPQRKPQRVSSYHINNNTLFWSLNLFGEPFHYSAPLNGYPSKASKQILLKSGLSLFSPLNCQTLAGLP